MNSEDRNFTYTESLQHIMKYTIIPKESSLVYLAKSNGPRYFRPATKCAYALKHHLRSLSGVRRHKTEKWVNILRRSKKLLWPNKPGSERDRTAWDKENYCSSQDRTFTRSIRNRHIILVKLGNIIINASSIQRECWSEESQNKLCLIYWKCVFRLWKHRYT